MYLHSREWYNAPANFLGLLSMCRTLEMSCCEKCSCGFISSAGFWVRFLFCGFAFWGCWLFFTPFKQLKMRGKEIHQFKTSTSRFTILHIHSFLVFVTISELCLLLHKAICFILLSYEQCRQSGVCFRIFKYYLQTHIVPVYI